MAKEYKVRQSQKTDTSENWSKASGFTPHKGEIIVYQDGDSSKIKIGTGAIEVGELPFVAGGGGAGTTTPQGGFVFGQEDNDAKAVGAMAVGTKQYAAGVPDDVSEDSEYLRRNEALGKASMVSGMGSVAFSRASKSLGYRTQTGYPTPEQIATGNYKEGSYKEGVEGGKGFVHAPDTLTDTEKASVATGNYGQAATAIGSDTLAAANNSFASGYLTRALANNSVASGSHTTAEGHTAHAEGKMTTAHGESSHAEGRSSKRYNSTLGTTPDQIKTSWDNAKFSIAFGSQSHSEGYDTLALGENSHTEGQETVASGLNSHAEGHQTTASGESSSAFGFKTVSSGKYAQARGNRSSATGESSSAEGRETISSGIGSHAEGYQTEAKGVYSHAEGYKTLAEALRSHAEGSQTKTLGWYSHAEGGNTRAWGVAAHAEGASTEACSDYCHAEGYQTRACGRSQHVQGEFNILDADYNPEDTSEYGRYLHIVGNGTADTKRSNAHTLDREGNAWFSGEVYVQSTSGKDRDEGSKRLATEEYVNSQIGAIELALNEIIESQALYMGQIDDILINQNKYIAGEV